MKLCELIEKSYCPNWLKDKSIKVSNEDITIIDNIVLWKGGTWKGGTWEGGIWKGGIWEVGVWKRGIWKGGIWKGGTWDGGTWKGGTWEGGVWEGGIWKRGIWKRGIWEGGIWKGGVWKGGIKAIGSCKWRIYYDVENKIIEIGCKRMTIKEWDKWFRSKKEFETKRNTKEFELIRKNYLLAKYAIKLGI